MFRNRRVALGHSRHSPASSYPGMALPDLSDGLFPDELDDPVNVSDRMALDAELGGDLLLAGEVGHDADLLYRMGHRLFAIELLAELQGRDSRMKVGMVGRADGHRVDVLRHRIEHLAEVVEFLRPGELGVGVSRPAGIDIAEGDNVLVRKGIQVGPSAASDADAGDVELLARERSVAGRGAARDPGPDSGHRRVSKHLPAADSLRHVVSPGYVFCRGGGIRQM